jgi:LacI family transcriptional regulator
MAKLRNVALVIDASQPYDRKIVQGVAAYLREVGRWRVYLEEGSRQKMPDLRRWSCDGIIADFDDPNVAEALRKPGIPVVGIGGGYGGYDPASGIPYFVSNEQAIARLAAEHLLERGFTNMAFCGFPRTATNLWSDARAEAFCRHIAKAGRACAVYCGRRRTTRDWDAHQRDLADWLAPLPKPLGLMACDDARARHVLEACQRLGLRVPDDVAVIGVDNNEMLCELSAPPLTSVEQGLRRMGYKAAALLDGLMSGRKPKPSRLRYVIDPETVVTRRSTEALAIDDAEVAAAARFVRDQACRGIRVPDVAAVIHVSRSTLERKFTSVVGRTVHAEIQRVRIERAGQLLATTNLPMKQVALRSGFRNLPYMTTLFRRRFGCTPAKWRRQATLFQPPAM